MDDMKEQIEKATEALKGKLSPKDLRLQKEVMEKVFVEGMSVREAINISQETVEFIYAHAYNLYKAGKYDDAIPIFHVLNFLDERDNRYRFALAACHQMKKEYAEALLLYHSCQAFDMRNPLYMWHAAECYLELGETMKAYLALRLCSQYSEGNAEFSSLQIRAQTEADALEKELDKEVKKTVVKSK